MDRLKLLALDERKNKERNEIPVRQPYDFWLWEIRKLDNRKRDVQEVKLYLRGKGIFEPCKNTTLNHLVA